MRDTLQYSRVSLSGILDNETQIWCFINLTYYILKLGVTLSGKLRPVRYFPDIDTHLLKIYSYGLFNNLLFCWNIFLYLLLGTRYPDKSRSIPINSGHRDPPIWLVIRIWLTRPCISIFLFFDINPSVFLFSNPNIHFVEPSSDVLSQWRMWRYEYDIFQRRHRFYDFRFQFKNQDHVSGPQHDGSQR